MKKYTNLALVLATALATFQASAITLTDDLQLTLSATALSDYRSFGVSQTSGDPALQLQAILSHSSGLFVGLWHSNVDFQTKARQEDGYYVGYTYVVNDNINIAGSLGRYEYPHESAFDTNEFYGEANIYKVKLGYVYDFDIDNHVPNLSSQFVGYTFDLPYETSLYAKYGYTKLNFDFYDNSGGSRQTYHDWEVKLSKDIFGVNWSVGYVDTDLSKMECLTSIGIKDACSATVVVGATKTF